MVFLRSEVLLPQSDVFCAAKSKGEAPTEPTGETQSSMMMLPNSFLL